MTAAPDRDELHALVDRLTPDQVHQLRAVADSIATGSMVAVPREDAWFWTKDWQAKEREADADREAGRYTEFERGEDFTAYLDDVIQQRGA